MAGGKHVGIIGAGAGGLCAARGCLNQGYSVTIFEQTDYVGGVWVYMPRTGVHSAMYETMK